MAQQIITCINCPVGCRMSVTTKDNEVVEISGNQCRRGDTYARQESVMPLRMVTAVAPVQGSTSPISLKTQRPIPKQKIMDVMAQLRSLKLSMPIRMGDVLLADAAGTGVPLVATKNLP